MVRAKYNFVELNYIIRFYWKFGEKDANYKKLQSFAMIFKEMHPDLVCKLNFKIIYIRLTIAPNTGCKNKMINTDSVTFLFNFPLLPLDSL